MLKDLTKQASCVPDVLKHAAAAHVDPQGEHSEAKRGCWVTQGCYGNIFQRNQIYKNVGHFFKTASVR